MAELVDAGQEAGEIAVRGDADSQRPPEGGGRVTLADLGIPQQRLSEARKLVKRVTPEQIDEMAAMAGALRLPKALRAPYVLMRTEQGASQRQIAAEVGVSQAQVQRDLGKPYSDPRGSLPEPDRVERADPRGSAPSTAQRPIAEDEEELDKEQERYEKRTSIASNWLLTTMTARAGGLGSGQAKPSRGQSRKARKKAKLVSRAEPNAGQRRIVALRWSYVGRSQSYGVGVRHREQRSPDASLSPQAGQTCTLTHREKSDLRAL
ncbi:MAG: hypothetical protein ABI725_02335 [Chloroflexota bacterium]